MRLLKIKSLPGVKESVWIDRDCIMLHACFQILQDFIEKEDGDNHCCYESHKDFIDEVRELYNWWLKRKHDDYDVNVFTEDNEMLTRLMKIRPQLWT
jgi:hypothetical protein